MRLRLSDAGRVVIIRQKDGGLIRGVVLRVNIPCRLAEVSVILNDPGKTIVLKVPFRKIVSVGDKEDSYASIV